MHITGKTKILGIIGNPIEHSMSPIFQNAAIALLGLDYVYVPFAVKKEDLEGLFTTFKAVDVRGFNVTIPHKESVLPFLHHVSDTARKIGAVNTVWLNQGEWYGTNTDIDGFIYPLQQLNRNWSEITPLVLGYGGASRAVVVGCSELLGCPEVKIFGRNKAKLEIFRESWAKTDLKAKISVYSWDELSNFIPHSSLIVNTTPVGMSSLTDESPLTPQQSSLIKQSAIAYDLIYNRSTLFLRQGKSQGATTIDGSEMLIKQGAIAFKIWTGKDAPESAMRETLYI